MNPPKTPQELANDAKAAYEAEEYAQAEAAFKAAQAAYTEAGDPLNAAEMANNLSVTLLKAGNPAAALQCIENTDQVFAQAGDLDRQAKALGNQATALDELKRYDEAMTRYQQSVEVFKQIGQNDMAALVLKRISNMQYRTHNRAAAMSTMLDALNLQSRLSLQDRILKGLMKIVSRLTAR